MAGGNQAITIGPQSLVDVVGSAVDNSLKTQRTISRAVLEKEQIQTQYAEIKKLSGQSLESFIGDSFFNDDRWKATDEFILQKRQEDERYNSVKTTAEMQAAAQQIARQSQIDLGNIGNAATPFNRITGQVIGGIGGAFADPVVLGTGLVGGLLVRTKTLLQLVAVEAGIGAATEIAIQPVVAGWQKEVGNEYGLGDVLTNVAFAGLASGALSGITSGSLKTSISTARNKGSVLFEAAAHYDKTPAYLKPVLQDMADYVSIKEQSPFLQRTIETDTLHAKNSALMDEAFSTGKKATDAEIEIGTNTKLVDGVTTKGVIKKSVERFETPEEEFRINDLRTNENLRVLDEVAQERVSTQERFEFDQFIEQDPDFTIRLDDGVDVRLSDIANDVRAFEEINKAIRTCLI